MLAPTPDPVALLEEMRTQLEAARELRRSFQLIADTVRVALEQTGAAARDLAATGEGGRPTLEAVRLFEARCVANVALINVVLLSRPRPPVRPSEASVLPPSTVVH